MLSNRMGKIIHHQLLAKTKQEAFEERMWLLRGASSQEVLSFLRALPPAFVPGLPPFKPHLVNAFMGSVPNTKNSWCSSIPGFN